ncbi:SusD/RagB family nutrient-binding outer membrane lipoprotein [Rudanella paleaurantiibacter]|uniref:SusD/RagB family nutrient-binding outer membrane lipoprotein n=1 Tax=Rudanella paleaurantiibacter TaxID=2614655 RepID=A0A7J5U2V1_9BACT|nr:SusD/RagB family nutrient-binding outer membrane lipoprotein [Rudanella paleaurantiibacter]KAB7731324.1 SusD/RagB family nutrient-binding outer membrane lipoprotein [Rudanella paleaurantiibacter]
MNLKKFSALLLAGLGLSLSSCDKYLDINKNPNNPDQVEAALLLAPIQNQYVLGIQFDARYIGSYVQNWHNATAGVVWDVHSYAVNSDAGGEIWRNVYWRGGRNTLNMMADAQANERWDYLGVGQVMQAWGWQMLTDVHGEIILKEAFDQDPNKNTFNYDTQEAVYAEVVRLLQEGIKNLNRADGRVSTASLGRGDRIYAGDRLKWKKFAYGLLAINAHHLSNKPSLYKPDQVIAYVDSAFTSNADDALFTFNGLSTADGSFFGPLRQNLQAYGQGAFPVRLMDGTVFTGVRDPRLPILLAASGDGTFRGINPGAGQSTATSVPVPIRVPSPWGTQVAVLPPAGTTGKFIFTDKGPFPLMTYAQLQFIKAEAAFIKGDKATALAAYRRGIEAHMSASWVNVPTADRTAYLGNPLVVPTSAASLTLSQIMLQKYIAQWGWGFLEQWSDLRRYNYSPDVFTSFQLPTVATVNNGKPAQRIRPRYNSEYVWNLEALRPLGGLELDYHTKPVWFTQP